MACVGEVFTFVCTRDVWVRTNQQQAVNILSVSDQELAVPQAQLMASSVSSSPGRPLWNTRLGVQARLRHGRGGGSGLRHR